MPRERLSNRRESQNVTFWHAGREYTARVSFYPDGRLAEVFLDNGKVGSDAQVNCRDAAVAMSLLLQHGCAAGDVARSLSRTESGEAESAIGALLDLLSAQASNDN
ncbi:TSCPD domain-containing protein [Bosea sp. LjRoot237]|uniref:TSCPD domain-containing protein n=1 Tax=Bosea sp. LjRoot237 TaxID=3342292 RepID=UPI003ED0FAEE